MLKQIPFLDEVLNSLRDRDKFNDKDLKYNKKPLKIKEKFEDKKINNGLCENFKDYLLLQINSSVFPLGAYAHSFGFENYINENVVSSADDAYWYLKSYINSSLKFTDLLAIRFAYGYAKNKKFKALIDLNENFFASKNTLEVKRSSILLGQSFLDAVENLSLDFTNDIFYDFVSSVKKRGDDYSYPIMYAIFCVCFDIELEDALKNYAFSSVESMIGIAVKTIPLGQNAGQYIITRLFPVIEKAIKDIFYLRKRDLFIATPGFEISSMRHECAFNRMYMS